MSAVLDTHQCDPQNWLGHTLYSQPAYCTTLIEQCVLTMKGTVIGYNVNNYNLTGVRKVKLCIGHNRR